MNRAKLDQAVVGNVEIVALPLQSGRALVKEVSVKKHWHGAELRALAPNALCSHLRCAILGCGFGIPGRPVANSGD
jgi:hypothetical protein